MVSTDIRVFCQDCAARWFVTFDGHECKPTPIEAMILAHFKMNYHRPAIITGHCKIEKTGPVNVLFNVGNLGVYKLSGTLTGWESSVRIYVEEVVAPQQ